MKHIQRILTLIACVLAMGVLCLSGFAKAQSVTAELSSDTLQAGETITLTVSVGEITASSLGVDISCDDALEITDGKWLKSGLIASFDPAKNKGVFAPGVATAISGDIFLVTLRAKTAAPADQTVSVTVIAKNGTATVLEETVTRLLSVSCASHTFGGYEAAAAEHSRSCTACGYTESSAHNWDSGKVSVAASCASVGEKIYTCTVCDQTKTEAIPKSAHTPETVGKKSSTCAKDGYTGDTYCADCGEKTATGTVIPATGNHVDADGKWESDADNHFHTCGCGAKFDTATHTGGTANCVDKAVCEVCGAKYGTVDSTKHGETEVRNASEATCSKDGYTGDTYCADCGEKIATGSVIPATGDHVDADGKWESDADNHFHTCGCGAKFDTAKHTGGAATCVDKAVCEVCGAEYGEIDADNHNQEIRGKVEASEDSEGYTGDTFCKDCGEKLADGETVAKLPHTHNMVKTEKQDATHEAAGNIEYYTCSKCGKLYKDEVGTEEITIEDTVIAKGEHTYEDAKDENGHWQECECGDKINEADHTYGEWTETKAPTATETGSRERICSECGYKQVEELPKLDVPPTGDTIVIVGVASVLAAIAVVVVVSKKKRVRS